MKNRVLNSHPINPPLRRGSQGQGFMLPVYSVEHVKYGVMVQNLFVTIVVVAQTQTANATTTQFPSGVGPIRHLELDSEWREMRGMKSMVTFFQRVVAAGPVKCQ